MKTTTLLTLPIILLITCRMITQPAEKTVTGKWESKNIQNYTIDQTRSCFCPHSGEVVRLTVKSGKIVSKILLSDSSSISYPYYYSIDSLIEIINGNDYDSIVVRYNEEFGFPEYMDVDPQQHPVDGGYLIETINFRQLN